MSSRQPSRRSDELLDLARQLVAECPSAFASEIAVTGSVAKGFADSRSDIEISCWTPAPIPEAELRDWLASIGASDIQRVPHSSEGWPSFFQFSWQGTWFDTGWMSAADEEDELRRMTMPGEDPVPSLVSAEAVVNAIVLRTAGALGRWRGLLSEYPESIARNRIEYLARFWRLPNWVESRWTLASRGQRLALASYLQMDLVAVHKIVFAVNREWEPDWKWLHETTAALRLKPDRLAERIDAAVAAGGTTGAVRICYELVRDTLAIVPSSIDVGQARHTIQASLAAHPPSPPSR